MNDPQIRAAFPVPEEPATLDAKIDRALAAQTKSSRTPRRLALGFALTAGVAVTLLVLPTRQAQASFVSILGALESSTHVRIVQTAVESGGRQVALRTVDVDGVDQHIYDAAGRSDEYDLGTHRLTFDPTLKAFVDGPRSIAGGAFLKVRFAPGKGSYAGMDSVVVKTVQNGVEVLRATVQDPGANVRFVFDASPVTRRPFVGVRQIQSPLGWRTVEITRFDYRASFRIAPPAATLFPRLSTAQAEARHRELLAKETLADIPLGKDRLVVRRLDVATDGTVFVAFQRGLEDDSGFRGYTFRLTDDLGTEYVRAGLTSVKSFGHATRENPPFEMEVFVPRTPNATWQPRRLRLQAHRFSNGVWAGTLERTERGADGVLHPWPGILTSSPGGIGPQPIDLPEFSFTRPTCGSAPTWAAIFDPTAYGDDRLTEIEKTEARADDALAYERWEDATRLYQETLDLKREAERLGYGPIRMEGDQQGLAKARATQRP